MRRRILFAAVLTLCAVSVGVAPANARPGPVAAFTWSPTAPTTGQVVHFDASASTCTATPCTYTWTDEPPGGGVWSLGSGPTLDFTFNLAATKYVNLVVTNNRGRSARVEQDVVVGAPATDTTPPTVSVTSPTSGATVSGTITIAANASDAGGVDHVAFRVDGNVVGSDSSAPYAMSYDTTQLLDDTHSFSAQAVDESGNTSTVSQVSATVRNSTPPPPPPPLRLRLRLRLRRQAPSPPRATLGSRLAGLRHRR